MRESASSALRCCFFLAPGRNVRNFFVFRAFSPQNTDAAVVVAAVVSVVPVVELLLELELHLP